MLWPIVILIFTVLFLVPMAFAWKSFAPWVPTRKVDMTRIFELANLKSGQVFYDLGSGDGRLVIYASKNFNARSIGLEAVLPLFIISQLRVIISGQSNVSIKWKNLFKESLSEADVIYLFGTTDTLGDGFEKKIENEVKPGARVISYAFGIGNLAPSLISRPSTKDLPIYVYQF